MNDGTNFPAQTSAQPVEPPAPAPAPLSLAERQERQAAWLQFPRRLVLLLIAFGVAQVLIVALQGPLLATVSTRPGQTLDWSRSLTTRAPVVQIVMERLPNTLLLLGVALFQAALLALGVCLVAVLVHNLGEKSGPLASVLKGMGRLWVFSQAAMPVFVMALFLILVFAVRLKLLPASGMFDAQKPGDLAGRVSRLILPILTLALLPAALTAQAVAREVTLPRARTGIRLWLVGLFRGLGVLLGQMGGLLGGAVLVETVFAWPGIGRLLTDYASRRDYPVLLGILSAYSGLILVGRLVAELFRWLERVVSRPVAAVSFEPTQWQRTARIIWVVAALLLLLAPLTLAIVGLTVNQDAALKVDAQSRNQPPSAKHSWGTDSLGRDIQARVLRGGLITIGLIALTAALVLLPGLLGGAATGLLASRRVWWAESLADLLLLPADALLFLPAIPAAMVMSILIGPARSANTPWAWLSVGVAVVLLPRAVRVYQALWVSAPEQHKGLTLGLAGTGALFLGSLWGGCWIITALEFMGYGVRPPFPTLGGLLTDAIRYLTVRPEGLLASGIVLGACAFAFYTAADALVGFFHSKEALVRLNE